MYDRAGAVVVARRLTTRPRANGPVVDLRFCGGRGVCRGLQVLAMRRLGNAGRVKAELGRAAERVGCPNGCGLLAEDGFLWTSHLAECPLRIVKCRFNCGTVPELQERERPYVVVAPRARLCVSVWFGGGRVSACRAAGARGAVSHSAPDAAGGRGHVRACRGRAAVCALM